ncbi:MAG: MBL fold metallo-hydrolase [Clostridiales bacterium]|nr:MBL fold metallo-hydrolase [Clostridiales bacterium]
MRLKVLGSGSLGNCYLLENASECLVLEAGINFKEVLKALNFNITKVVGCLVTHEHKDHSKYVREFIKNGICVYMSKGTVSALNLNSHYINYVKRNEYFKVGNFKIIPFNTKHDAAEPLGYYINHKETGNILFATDTYYILNKFKDLNNILIECNYSGKILEKNIQNGSVPIHLKERIIRSHMEFETCEKCLRENDLRQTNNVVLIHLSDNNSDAKMFRREIQNILPYVNVAVAEKGLNIEFNKYRF